MIKESRRMKTIVCACSFFYAVIGYAQPAEDTMYPLGTLSLVSSTLKVSVGQPAPDFTLPSISGENITLSHYRGKRNVILAFVPAAWTPVCSNQIHEYSFYEDLLTQHNAIIMAMSVDNVPTLYDWTKTIATSGIQ